MSFLPSREYYFDVAQDKISGIDSEFKFGRSSAITTTESVVWDNGGNYTFITAAETMDVVSTSTNDTSAGTGARTVMIYGLDASYAAQSELITMNGTTAVTSTNSYLRIFRAMVITSGTNDPINNSNLGDITVTGTTSSTLMAKILTGNGQTLMCVYTVPASTTGYITGLSASAGQGKQCLFKAKARNGADSGYAFSVKYTLDLYQSSFNGPLQVPFKLPEKTDLVVTGITTSGTIDASASLGIILVTN